MKRSIIIILLVIIISVPFILQTGCDKSAKRTANDIAGQWELINVADLNLANAYTQLMTITAVKGKKFIVRGIGWVGQGEVNGQNAYYDWKFDDGRTGRTTMTINYDDNSFKGHVLGSGLDWTYLARRPWTGKK